MKEPLVIAGLEVSLYFQNFLAFPTLPHLIQNRPIIPIILELKGRKRISKLLKLVDVMLGSKILDS